MSLLSQHIGARIEERISSNSNDVIDSAAKRKSPWCRFITVLGFIIINIFVLILVTLMRYAFLLTKVLFASLIIWRGLSVFDDSFSEILRNVANSLEFTLHVPYVSYLIYPFVMLVQELAKIHIDLAGISVTCEGSQAPIQVTRGRTIH